jgi:hypothetical protein
LAGLSTNSNILWISIRIKFYFTLWPVKFPVALKSFYCNLLRGRGVYRKPPNCAPGKNLLFRVSSDIFFSLRQMVAIRLGQFVTVGVPLSVCIATKLKCVPSLVVNIQTRTRTLGKLELELCASHEVFIIRAVRRVVLVVFFMLNGETRVGGATRVYSFGLKFRKKLNAN